jgi:CubicO group peptidase (beta-lactamase class C family)
MRPFHAGILLFALSLPAAHAGTPAAPLPEWKTQVDALLAEYDRSDSPGCSLGVFRDGRIAYARGYGMANLELGVANSRQTVFDIGSLGKQFTAFSILLLARDGKLALDDDIRRFLPEIPDYGKRVTIRHLLHHTGGLRDYIELLELAGAHEEDVTTEGEAFEALARQRAPLFPPGQRYLYSNSGYFLLGLIVKRASGQSLRDFARDRIFGPLEMTHTQYNEDHTRVIPNRSTGYSPREGGGFSIEMSDFEQNGDGGVLTSVEDLFLWDRNFADPVVGDRQLLVEMERTGVLNDGKPIDYAAGLRVGSYRGLRTVGHTGSWAGYLALLYRFPDQRFSVACLCNRTGVNRLRLMRQIADITLADKMTQAPTPAARPTERLSLSPAELARYRGAFRDPKTEAVWFLSVEGGALVANAQGSRIGLEAVAPGRFVPKEGGSLEITFEEGKSGARPSFTASWEAEERQRFEPIEVWSPSPAKLQDFAGLYTSDEVPALFRFAVLDGRLVLRHRVLPGGPWPATLPDSFAHGEQSVTFTRDAAGRVNGFRLASGEMTGLVFRRIGS